MVMLEQDPFLTELTKLLVKSKESGSVWITMKRSARVGCTKVQAKEAEGKCIIRATDGKKKKISTVVEPGISTRFHASLLTVCKAHMDSLKKREKKPKKK